MTLSQGTKLETHWYNKSTQQIKKKIIIIIMIMMIIIIVIIRLGQWLGMSNPLFMSKFVKKMS